jgi:hypothetical protein
MILLVVTIAIEQLADTTDPAVIGARPSELPAEALDEN